MHSEVQAQYLHLYSTILISCLRTPEKRRDKSLHEPLISGSSRLTQLPLCHAGSWETPHTGVAGPPASAEVEPMERYAPSYCYASCFCFTNLGGMLLFYSRVCIDPLLVTAKNSKQWDFGGKALGHFNCVVEWFMCWNTALVCNTFLTDGSAWAFCLTTIGLIFNAPFHPISLQHLPPSVHLWPITSGNYITVAPKVQTRLANLVENLLLYGCHFGLKGALIE